MVSIFFRLLLSLLLVIVASFSFSQNTTDIKFNQKTQKFSKINKDTILEFEYTFTYTGEEPLTIIPPKVDCSCTEVILPKEPIQPNSTNTIKITFNTEGKIGYQEREILLYFVSDSMDSRSIEKKIVFKGVVASSKPQKKSKK